MKIVKNQLCDDGLAPKEHTIEAGGLRWHTLEWGDHGPPFVLWHGITSSARGWWRTGPLLAGLGFHVWAPDMPGHGYTDDTGSYAAERTARLLDQWLATLQLERPVVLGHSWGGMNALVHALLPDAQVRPRAIVLEDPAFRLTNDPSSRLPYYTAGLGTPRDDAACAQIAAANPRWHACDVCWKAEARELARRSAVEGFFCDNAGIDLVDRLRAFAIPTYLLLGDPTFGGIWTADDAALVQGMKRRHITVEMIPESSHNLHRDTWVSFSMALGAWARRFVGPAGSDQDASNAPPMQRFSL
jgi:pimeloyl-ACP methyl ester carboxylesterase